MCLRGPELCAPVPTLPFAAELAADVAVHSPTAPVHSQPAAAAALGAATGRFACPYGPFTACFLPHPLASLPGVLSSFFTPLPSYRACFLPSPHPCLPPRLLQVSGVDPATVKRWRRKFLFFPADSDRPAYYGSWTKPR